MTKEFLAEGGKIPYDIGVCIQHCCAEHGCKYGKPECAVYVLGYKQAYPCEFCDEECGPMETVTIKKKVYDELLEDQRLLIALQNAGVDNWEGWYQVIEEFKSD